MVNAVDLIKHQLQFLLKTMGKLGLVGLLLGIPLIFLSNEVPKLLT